VPGRAVPVVILLLGTRVARNRYIAHSGKWGHALRGREATRLRAARRRRYGIYIAPSTSQT
jgi:hypothetical protein